MSGDSKSFGLEPLRFNRLEKKLDVSLIDISESNVRKEKPRVGLEELKGSMEKVGLIHPIVVLEKRNGRFDLLVGQRRLLAAKDLGWTHIAALVIEPLNDVSKSVVSLGENLHRRDIPYSDTITVCRTLFARYGGTNSEKIDHISATLGLSRRLVVKYLGYDLVPKKVKDMVEAKKLKPQKAFDITAAFWPNKEKIASVAERVAERKFTTGEFDRMLELGTIQPEEPVDKIIEEAKKPPPLVEIRLMLPRQLAGQLQTEADHRGITVGDLII